MKPAHRSKTFPQWKGFEVPVLGCLLDQIIDIEGNMGVAYERSCQFYKDYHVHDRLMLVFPRSGCQMEVRTFDKKMTFRFGERECLIVPAFDRHDDEGISAIYDTLALYPHQNLLTAIHKETGLSPEQFRQFTASYRKIKKSVWLTELVNRYFFDRIVQKTENNATLELYAQKILEETMRIAFPTSSTNDTKLIVPHDSESPSARAIRYIESHLFSNLNTSKIAKNAGTSPSTLLRAFQADIKMSPLRYVTKRRLEEACTLLEKKDRSVGEIALLVGYKNFGAFSEAFLKQYAVSPSKWSTKANRS